MEDPLSLSPLPSFHVYVYVYYSVLGTHHSTIYPQKGQGGKKRREGEEEGEEEGGRGGMYL